MNRVAVLSILVCFFVSVTFSQRCSSRSACPAGYCCPMAGLPIIGRGCRPLAALNQPCSLGRINLLNCPCQAGLRCYSSRRYPFTLNGRCIR